MVQNDHALIRATLAIARRARERGNHPFGALLADSKGRILLEAENTVVTGKDCTGHAETNLMRAASKVYSHETLAECTAYASTEPCPMCAGAIFWGEVRRVVYGLSQEHLYEIIGDDPAGAALHLPCREVFDRGKRQVEVRGPLLEAEAEEVHRGFWL